MKNRLKKIFIVSGKGRHGKDTTCSFIREICEEKGLKTANLAFGSYIKDYTKKITGWDGDDATKKEYRSFFQMIGTEIVRSKIDVEFFIKRLCDDIKVYSYFFDIITVSDARFENEIEMPRKMFQDVIIINIKRINFETDLTIEEQKHITETALDNYNEYDYRILNDSTLESLKEKIKEIIEGEL